MGTTVPLVERHVLIEDVLRGIPGDPPVRSADTPPALRGFAEYGVSTRWHLVVGASWARRARVYDSDSFLANTGLPVATGKSVTKVGQLRLGVRYVFLSREWFALSASGALAGGRSKVRATGGSRLANFSRDLVDSAFANSAAWSVGATVGLAAEHAFTPWLVVRIRADVLLYSRSMLKTRVTDEFVGSEAILPRRDLANVDLVPRPALELRFVL